MSWKATHVAVLLAGLAVVGDTTSIGLVEPAQAHVAPDPTIKARSKTKRVSDATDAVIEAAREFGVPINLAIAVAKAESGLRCGVVGAAGEVGPLQVKPATSRYIGLPVSRRSNCYEQTRAGMLHLAKCYQGTSTMFAAAACHNQGLSVAAGRRIADSARRYAGKIIALMERG